MAINKRWQIRIFFIGWMFILLLFIRQSRFGFLLLNTFLGYIPIELSFHIKDRKHENGFVFWILTVLWMLFYPNSPYVLTDLLHLSWLNAGGSDGVLRTDPNVWFLFTALIISALVCAFIGFWSMIHVARAIDNRIHLSGSLFEFLTIIVLSILSSVGLYIGRFLRVHTVYLFINPTVYVKPFLQMWTPHMLVFVILMTIIQLVIYWIYNVLNGSD